MNDKLRKIIGIICMLPLSVVSLYLAYIIVEIRYTIFAMILFILFIHGIMLLTKGD